MLRLLCCLLALAALQPAAGFLVIGQPKCATSSLLSTLAAATALPGRQTGSRTTRRPRLSGDAVFGWSAAGGALPCACLEELLASRGALRGPACADLGPQALQSKRGLPHSDSCEHTDEELASFFSREVIYKQHMLPGARELARVAALSASRAQRVVLLTCPPLVRRAQAQGAAAAAAAHLSAAAAALARARQAAGGLSALAQPGGPSAGLISTAMYSPPPATLCGAPAGVCVTAFIDHVRTRVCCPASKRCSAHAHTRAHNNTAE